MTVIVGGVIRDGGCTHTIAVVMITREIVPVILHMIVLTTIIILVGSSTAIGKGHARQGLTRPILIDSRGNAGQQVTPSTIGGRERTISTRTIAKGTLLIGEGVAVIKMAGATIIAYIGFDRLQ